MGIGGSKGSAFNDYKLTAQSQPLVAVGKRFAHSTEVTQLLLTNAPAPHSDGLAFEDPETCEAVFRARLDAAGQTFLLDTGNQPIVKLAKKQNSGDDTYYVYGTDTSPETDGDNASELFQIYFKLDWMAPTESLRVDFTDETTGDRCRISMEGDWSSFSAMLWLDRASSSSISVRSLVGRIFVSACGPRSDYCVEIAPNVDAALMLAICAVLNEEMKQE